MKQLLRSLISRVRGETSTGDLIRRGLVVGRNFRRNERCIIDPSHCWLISIGDDVTLAPNVHILAHDASMWSELGYTRIAPVSIGNNVFIGAGSILLPGVTIGHDVVIGAGSVVTKDIQPNTVVAGNPAQPRCSYEEFIAKNRQRMIDINCFDESYTLRNRSLTHDMKEQMKTMLKRTGCGYVK